MTLQPSDATGEASTKEQAQARLDRIFAVANDICSSTAIMCAEVEAAYFARDWEAMGYSSWESYQEACFPRLRLPREERRELVSSLREAGLSTRAISATTGASKGTVGNDIKAGAQSWARDGNTGELAESTPAVTGLDGKSYAAYSDASPEPIEAELVDDQPATGGREPAVTPEPAPKKKPRKPITDQARTKAAEGLKWAGQLEKLMNDDRYARNRNELSVALRGDLLLVRDVVNKALDTLDHVPNGSHS